LLSSFLVLYRGGSVATAKIVAVSANPELVGNFASRMLSELPEPAVEEDPVLESIEGGRRRALQFVEDEAQ
jgi:hypothetical protein